MKKLIAACLFIALSTLVYADHPAGTGIGAVVGTTLGDNVTGNLGLSLKLPSIPIFWAIRVDITDQSFGLGVTGDKYLKDANLISEKGFNLDWYFGLGGYAGLGAFGGDMAAACGARLPIGLSWHATKEIEVFLTGAPSIGVALAPSFHFPEWFVAAELGGRFWIK